MGVGTDTGRAAHARSRSEHHEADDGFAAVLTAIAEARPSTLAGLRRVKGMGPAKLEKYGDGILGVVAGLD